MENTLEETVKMNNGKHIGKDGENEQWKTHWKRQ